MSSVTTKTSFMLPLCSHPPLPREGSLCLFFISLPLLFWESLHKGNRMACDFLRLIVSLSVVPLTSISVVSKVCFLFIAKSHSPLQLFGSSLYSSGHWEDGREPVCGCDQHQCSQSLQPLPSKRPHCRGIRCWPGHLGPRQRENHLCQDPQQRKAR